MSSIIHQGLQLNAVIDPETGAALEYRHLIQDFTTKILGRRQFIGFNKSLILMLHSQCISLVILILLHIHEKI